LRLSRLNEKECRFCNLLTNALDAFSSDWRRRRPHVTIDLVWGKPIRLTIGALHNRFMILEIYSPNSELSSLCFLFSI
jgi:hypothetical protein